jgi:hypothetical protein
MSGTGDIVKDTSTFGAELTTPWPRDRLELSFAGSASSG